MSIEFILFQNERIFSKKLSSSSNIIILKGDRNRTERAKLSSADPNTAELHDQFYRDHKLLLVLFRVLAVMPVTRSSPG